MFRVPPHDPFDHSHCHHPRPRWPLELTPTVRVDLFYILHELWKFLMYANIPAAVAFIEQFNDMLIQSALDMGDELDAEIQAQMDTVADLQTLGDESAFTAELMRLLGETPNDVADGDPEADDTH